MNRISEGRIKLNRNLTDDRKRNNDKILQYYRDTLDLPILRLSNGLSDNQIDMIGSALESFEPRISSILSIRVYPYVDFEHFIRDRFFPKAELYLISLKSKTDIVREMYAKEAIEACPSNLLIIKNYYTRVIDFSEIPCIFNGDLILLIGGSGKFDELERQLMCFWEKIVDISVGSFWLMHKMLIFRYNSDPTDEIYEFLRYYFENETIPIGGSFELRDRIVSDMIKFFADEKINRILAINAGDGKSEMAISKLLFPKAKIYLTDIVPSHRVEKLSAAEAISRYSDCDLMITCRPDFRAKGYKNIVRHFQGKYILFIGEEGGSCDPENCFISQLKSWGIEVFRKEILCIELKPWIIVYRKNENRQHMIGKIIDKLFKHIGQFFSVIAHSLQAYMCSQGK